jgi:hypothetical protein
MDQVGIIASCGQESHRALILQTVEAKLAEEKELFNLA